MKSNLLKKSGIQRPPALKWTIYSILHDSYGVQES